MNTDSIKELLASGRTPEEIYETIKKTDAEIKKAKEEADAAQRRAAADKRKKELEKARIAMLAALGDYISTLTGEKVDTEDLNTLDKEFAILEAGIAPKEQKKVSVSDDEAIRRFLKWIM